MTNLSISLGNALSGLAAAGRMSETISSNVSNALNDGYARRETLLGQRVLAGTGNGVNVVGVQRHVDPVLQSERRVAEAELAKAMVRTDFFAKAEFAIGLPDDPGSLSGQLTRFGSSIIEAASRPDSTSRLQLMLDAANSLANRFNSASDAIQQERMNADVAIGNAVEFINTSLQQIHQLNTQALRARSNGSELAALQDERQRLVDAVSEFVPVREVTRENGSISLFTPGGAILLDSSPAQLEFTPVGLITPDMAIGGALSGLSINGNAVSTDPDRGAIAGGKLAALFDVRDTQAPAAQLRLDAVARDLIERFADPAVDTTLTAGDPGLFTDTGAAFAAANEVGIAGRISVNALVDPAQGGELWRLRDGLGATTPGAAGDATLLNALSDTFNDPRIPASGGFTAAQSATGVAGSLIAGIGANYSGFSSQLSFVRSRAETLVAAEGAQGVDTDVEMQNLLLVEQAFAANAKVIATIDELLQTLLRI